MPLKATMKNVWNWALDDYISKPVKMEELAAILRKFAKAS
jgi:DNA-binding response OmpR family regulator